MVANLAAIYTQFVRAGGQSTNSYAHDDSDRVPILQTIINVHTEDRNEVSYRIPSPLNPMPIDEYDDNASDASELDPPFVVVIHRSSCRSSCCAAKAVDGALPPIQEITWMD